MNRKGFGGIGILLGIVLVLAGLVTAFYLGRVSITTRYALLEKPPYPTSFPSPTPDPRLLPLESTEDLPLITAAVVDYALKTGNGKPDVSFSSNNGELASGGLSQVGFAGGAAWFAAKINGTWTVIHVGQAQPKCSDVAQYNLPDKVIKDWLKCDSE